MNCLRFTSNSLTGFNKSLAILGRVASTEEKELRARAERLKDREEELRWREDDFWARVEEQETYQVRRTRKKDETTMRKTKRKTNQE